LGMHWNQGLLRKSWFYLHAVFSSNNCLLHCVALFDLVGHMNQEDLDFLSLMSLIPLGQF
jgi:hypothetical protein